MKKIIAAVLLAAMALSLLSCSKPEFYELDSESVVSVEFVARPEAEINKTEFVKAYNAAEVKGPSYEIDMTGKSIIVVPINDGDDVITIYYLTNNEFWVTGTNLEKDYIIEAPELYELYTNIVDPPAEFVKIDPNGNYDVFLTSYPEAQVDKNAFIKAYNEAKFVEKAGPLKGGSDVITFSSAEYIAFYVYYLGDDRFAVSGAEVDVPFIINSAELAKLYEEAIK